MTSFERKTEPMTNMATAIVVFAVGVWGSLALARSASAHDLPQERALLLEIKPEGLEAMVVYQEPPGERVDLIKAQSDFNRDGALTGPDAVAAASAWVPRALQGLEFEAEGTELDRDPPRVKFRNEHNGALSSAIYLRWDWEELDADAERTIRLTRSEDSGTFETLVRFQTSSPLQFTSSSTAESATSATGRIGPFALDPDATVAVTVTRSNQTSESEASSESPEESKGSSTSKKEAD